MNQKISNAPVIGMIVAIMLLTLSVGVNIWLYNENSRSSDILYLPAETDTLTVTELERRTNMDWGCYSYAAVTWATQIERGFLTSEDNDEVGKLIQCVVIFENDLYALHAQAQELERR